MHASDTAGRRTKESNDGSPVEGETAALYASNVSLVDVAQRILNSDSSILQPLFVLTNLHSTV